METPFEDKNSPEPQPEAKKPEISDPPPTLDGDNLDEAVMAAISRLDPENETYWTSDGKPHANILTSMVRQKLSGEQRDRAWEKWQARKQAQDEAAAAAKTAPGVPARRDALKWDGKWAVIDTNAKGDIAREHYPMGIDKPSVKLRGNRETPLDRAIATKFLCDRSFIVFNAFGDRVESLPDAEVHIAGRSPSLDLAPNEVVAKLGELSLEALLIRVNRMPGGEEFNEGSHREAIEEFYVDARLAAQKGRGEILQDGVPQLQELSARDVDRLLAS